MDEGGKERLLLLERVLNRFLFRRFRQEPPLNRGRPGLLNVYAQVFAEKTVR